MYQALFLLEELILDGKLILLFSTTLYTLDWQTLGIILGISNLI